MYLASGDIAQLEGRKDVNQKIAGSTLLFATIILQT